MVASGAAAAPRNSTTTDSRPVPIRCEMASIVPSRIGNGSEAFLTIIPTDNQPHLIAIRPDSGAQVEGIRTFRAWWDGEEPYAARLLAGINREERVRQELDTRRWWVIGAFAPALWPLAGGYVGVIAEQESAERGSNPYQLPWEQMYQIPEVTPAQLVLPGQGETIDEVHPPMLDWAPAPAPMTTPLTNGCVAIEVRPDLEDDGLLPAQGLVLNLGNSDRLSLEVQEIFDDGSPGAWAPLQVHCVRRYGDATAAAAVSRWRSVFPLQLSDLLSAWQGDAPLAGSIAFAPAAFTVTLADGSGSTPLPRATAPPGPDFVSRSVPMGWLSLLAYLTAGWILASPATPISLCKRLGVILLGWLGGWAVAVAAMPLMGLGFLPGAAVTAAIWQWGSVGKFDARQVGLTILFLVLWSAVLLPLFLAQGLLPPA